jgi:hypothetical protein
LDAASACGRPGVCLVLFDDEEPGYSSLMTVNLLIRRSFVIVLIATILVAVGCGSGDTLARVERRLIAKADAICANGLRATKRVEEDFGSNPAVNLKHNVDYAQSQRQISYAQALLDISMSKVERLSALQPPASMRDAYEKYVDGERQIYYADLKAVHAAHSVHTGEYSAALTRHRNEQERNVDRADEIGLVECARE